jgi:hypothetical protein
MASLCQTRQDVLDSFIHLSLPRKRIDEDAMCVTQATRRDSEVDGIFGVGPLSHVGSSALCAYVACLDVGNAHASTDINT